MIPVIGEKDNGHSRPLCVPVTQNETELVIQVDSLLRGCYRQISESSDRTDLRILSPGSIQTSAIYPNIPMAELSFS